MNSSARTPASVTLRRWIVVATAVILASLCSATFPAAAEPSVVTSQIALPQARSIFVPPGRLVVSVVFAPPAEDFVHAPDGSLTSPDYAVEMMCHYRDGTHRNWIPTYYADKPPESNGRVVAWFSEQGPALTEYGTPCTLTFRNGLAGRRVVTFTSGVDPLADQWRDCAAGIQCMTVLVGIGVPVTSQ